MRDLRKMPASPLAVGLAIAAVLILAAVLLGRYVLATGTPRSFDQATADTMKAMGDARPAKGEWMAALTHLGDNPFLAVVAVLGSLWYFWQHKRWLAIAWVLIALGALFLNEGLKRTFQRERPPEALRDPAAHRPTSHAYPSGHALGSMVIYGLLAYSMLLEAKRGLYKVVIVAEMALIIGAIAFSRVYLRVHWLSDVLAGLLIGAAWLALTLGVLENYRRRHLPTQK